jgi:peptidoglycan/xylan/chitin deacetylase (PgdA/CDA1 family)
MSTVITPSNRAEQASWASLPSTGWASAKHWLGTWSAAALAQLQPYGSTNQFGILMYHRVVNRVAGYEFPTWNVTPKQFRRQMTGLLRDGFRAWPLRKLLDYRANKKTIPESVFVVTFDDAYECVYTQAFPILKELRIPATVFLSTAYLDSPEPFPFDDWSGKGQPNVPSECWRPLSHAQCSEMQASGLIELGAHTHTHADFRGQPELFRQDLQLNLNALRERFGLFHATFAFPYGTRSSGFTSAALMAVTKELGMLCSLNTEPEPARLQGDIFDWGRFNVEPNDNAATLAGKLTGWFSDVRQRMRHLEYEIRNWSQNTATNVARLWHFSKPLRSS